MSRKSEALKRIDTSKGQGLELGPLSSPLVSKQKATVFYVDHLSTEGLRKHYEGHGFEDEIVPVDYVIRDDSLSRTLAGKQFDYVIASHVIEHIPDMVGWLADVGKVLKEGGIFSLVIPDKRYTFDIMRNESRPADVIGAYLDKQTKVSSAVVYDNFSAIRKDIVPYEVCSHPYADYGKKPTQYSLEKAYELCLQNLKPGEYVDTHCHVFTPHSFFTVLRGLIEHDLFGYEVIYFKDTPPNQLEFYVSLRKVSKNTRAARLKSIPKVPRPKEKRELELEIIELRQANEALTAELRNVMTSKSWQITKPVRKAVKLSHRIRRK